MQAEPSSEKTRKSRSDKGQKRLRKRDFAALRWIGEQYVVSVDDLGIVLGRLANRQPLKDRAVRAVVARWHTFGFVKTSSALSSQYIPLIIWLTPSGLRLMEMDYPAYEPSLSKVRHMLAINHVRLFLENTLEGAYQWQGEREIRASFQDNTLQGAMPDALVTWKDTRIAIEAELTPKTMSRYGEIFKSHIANGFGSIWYFVNDRAAATVRKQINKSPMKSSIRLRHLNELGGKVSWEKRVEES